MRNNGRSRAAWGLVLALASCVAGPKPVTPLAPAAPLANGVDLHEHVIMHEALPFFSGEPGDGALATSPYQQFVNQIDAPTLRRAGVRLVVAALWPPFNLRPGRSARGEALHQLEQLRAFTRRRPDFVLAYDAAQARALLAGDRIVLVPGLEGAEGIGSVEDVDRLYAAGARVISLVHFSDNALAGAERGQFGPVFNLLFNRAPGGLTPLGEAVVRRMMALGIVIDVSHASPPTIRDVLALTGPRGVPVLSSHAGVGNAAPLNVDDASAEAIARQGGLVGIGVYDYAFLPPVPEADRREGHQLGTCDDLVAHWIHYARVAGPEHVVLGSDFSSVILRPGPGGVCPDGIRHTGDLPALFAGVIARGYPREALDRSGDRFLELMERVQAAADPAARAAARRAHAPPEDLFDVPL